MSGDDDFFGGSITPPTTGPAPGATQPHLSHKDYGSFGPATASAPSATSNLPLIVGAVVVLGVLALGFLGYRMYFAPAIVFPDELMGMDRLESDSDLGRAVDQAWKQAESTFPDGVNADMAVYMSGASMLMVAAGDVGTDEFGDADDYFNSLSQGIAQQAPQLKLTVEDPGSKGGELRCATQAAMGICAWVDEETFGLVVTSGLMTDSAETARSVREAVQK